MATKIVARGTIQPFSKYIIVQACMVCKGVMYQTKMYISDNMTPLFAVAIHEEIFYDMRARQMIRKMDTVFAYETTIVGWMVHA